VTAALFVLGVLFVLYGLLALTFNVDGGSTTVNLAGHRFDAHRVGAVCLVLAVCVMSAAIVVLRRGRARP
jgi:hypothetical protein